MSKSEKRRYLGQKIVKNQKSFFYRNLRQKIRLKKWVTKDFDRYFDEKTVIQDFDEKSKWKLVTSKTKSRPIELSLGSKEPPRPGRINSSL